MLPLPCLPSDVDGDKYGLGFYCPSYAVVIPVTHPTTPCLLKRIVPQTYPSMNSFLLHTCGTVVHSHPARGCAAELSTSVVIRFISSSLTQSQVGPLDINTGTWIWHQELQAPSFCNILLDELENLFVDIGAGSMDRVNTISLLLPIEDVRAIALLRSMRRKTFSWVQELSHDLTLAMASMNEERGRLSRDMTATCRSTFDVDPAIRYTKSSRDVDTLLSCAFFIYALRPSSACMSSF